MITKRILAMLLVAVSGRAMAEWIPLNPDASAAQTTYVNRVYALLGSNIVSMGNLRDFRTPQRINESPEPMYYRSVEKHFDYDCLNRKMRLKSFTFYVGNMGEGSVVLGDSDTSESDWQDLDDDSLEASLFDHACENVSR